MGKKRIDRAIEVSKATMLGDLRDTILEVFKRPTLPNKAWQKMTEAEQREVAGMVTEQVERAIARAINIIASEGRKHIKVTLKTVTVKDGIKGQFETNKTHELRHDLIDAQGDTVLIVLTDTSKYLGEKSKVKYDKDQPDLVETDDAPAKSKKKQPKEKPANEQPDEEEDDEVDHDPDTGEIEGDDVDDDEVDDEEDLDDEDSDDEDDDDLDDEDDD